jgi:hypothetical protein
MELEVFAALHGFGGADRPFASLAAALPALTAARVAGVEASISLAEAIPDFRSQLGEHGLDFIATASVDDADATDVPAALAQLVDDAAFHRPRLLAIDGALEATDDVTGLLRALHDLADDAPFPVALVVRLSDLRGAPIVALVDRSPASAVLMLDATGAHANSSTFAVRRAAPHVAHLRVAPGIAQDAWLATWSGHHRAGRPASSVGVSVGAALDEARAVRLAYDEWSS